MLEGIAEVVGIHRLAVSLFVPIKTTNNYNTHLLIYHILDLCTSQINLLVGEKYLGINDL